MAQRRIPSSAARPSATREWLLFGAAALLPTIGLGALGLRALGNEEAAIRREASLAVASVAQRAASTTNASITTATDALARSTFDDAPSRAPNPKAWLEAAKRAAPDCGAAVVVSPSGNLALPTEQIAVTSTPPDPTCSALVGSLATATPGERSGAKERLLAGCPEARSELGRWLWPSFALESLHDHPDEALAKSLDAWLRSHAATMRPGERAATASEIAQLGGVDEATKKSLASALEGEATTVDGLVRAIHGDAATKAIRAAAGDSVTFRGSGAVGVLRPLSGGWLVGFVVTTDTLADAMATAPARYGASSTVRIEVEGRSRRVEQRPGAEPLRATEWIAEGLGVSASLAKPDSLDAQTSRSVAWLSAVAIVGGLSAIALAVASFIRMRAARRTSELRTSFVAAVSHELRTPIASVRMLAELLEEGRVDEDERAEVHEALAREARRLGETVDRLLGFSRMSADKVVLERANVALATPVRRAIERFRERNPEVSVEESLDESVVADVDAVQVELCVDNLLGNAMKYAPKGGPYGVAVVRDGDEARLSVSDRGPGIARRDQKRIFDAFERVDDRLSKATEGSGIGLSLVAHAARAHGGRAGVESEPGRGATFFVAFPLARALSSHTEVPTERTTRDEPEEPSDSERGRA